MGRKRENFVRLAESRVSKAISTIRSIGKLSNTSHYDYHEEDVRKIYSALRAELDTMRDLFSKQVKRDDEFKL